MGQKKVKENKVVKPRRRDNELRDRAGEVEIDRVETLSALEVIDGLSGYGRALAIATVGEYIEQKEEYFKKVRMASGGERAFASAILPIYYDILKKNYNKMRRRKRMDGDKPTL